MGELYRPENNPDISGKIEKDIIGGGFDFERIENLPDSAEPGVFYRGVPAEDALSGILGKLIVEANPKGESHILGPRDNVSLRLNEAVASFKEAVRINPKHADAHYGLGTAYVNLGEIKLATKEYVILKDMDSKMADRLFQLIMRRGSPETE